MPVLTAHAGHFVSKPVPFGAGLRILENQMFPKSQKRKFFPALVLCLAAAAPAVALQPVYAQGSGKAATSSLPKVSLNAQVFETVAQDTVTIVLATDVSQSKQDTVTQKLSETLDSVMKEAKAQQKVQVRSGNYRVWPNTDEDGDISSWRGSAEVVLESSDFSAASALAAQLSDRMPIRGMNFSVSKALRAEREQALLVDAAKAFQARAQTVAESFGYASYRLKHVEVGGSGYTPEPVPHMAMAPAAFSSKSRSSVPVEPGTETISLSMQGEVFLLKK